MTSGSIYSNSNSYGLTRVAPSPVAAITLTHRFTNYSFTLPNSAGSADVYPTQTQSSDTIFFGGRTTGATNKITAFNTTTETEQDLTDDASFVVSSMAHNDGKLYLLGYKGGNLVAAVKDLGVGGGTTLTTLDTATYTNLSPTEIAPVVP